MLGDNAAVGVVLSAGSDKKELLLNAGYRLDERQRFILSAGQLEQFLDYAFLSGAEKVGIAQNSGGVSYQLQLGQEFLRYLEINGYVAKTASRDLADKTFAIDSATLYELWSDPRRIAGGKVSGLQGRLGFSPLAGSVVKVSLGQERLSYDLLAGTDSVNRLTGGVEWLQQLGSGYQFKIAADTYASQNSYTLGLERSLAGTTGRHHLGVSLVSLHGRDGLGDDNQIKLTYSYAFGASGMAKTAIALNPAANTMPGRAPSPVGGSLLNRVAQRPSFIPSNVVAKIDATALPTRLIAVDKTALPAGASIDTASGDVTAPLGVAVTGIAGVTQNGAAFANSGQFSLSGNSLVIKPSLIVQPAAGVTDTYVVTLNNLGGGTTWVTVLVSHGSVKIDSISIASDTAAPATTAAPAVSGTTDTGTTLTATINETGTGYYLVQAAAAEAPTVAAVQAGTAFAMTANVAAIATISGLTASTPYKIYFVAKDAANNVQAAVQSVAVSPSAAPTAPSASSVAISGTAQVGQVLTGSYTYADSNSDPQGTSTFRWLRNGAAIAGATAGSYTLVNADQGNTITFEVTPVSTVAPTTGTPVASSATAAVAGAAVAPTAPTASAVAISGTAQVGQVLTGSYTYTDANSDPQGTSTFRWLRNGAAIAGATAGSYTLVNADQGNAITFEVTPVSTVAPATGTPIVSTATASVAVAAAAPTASVVSISGTAQVGQTLTGSYIYADANSDPQGTSTFRWLRNGTAIAGATAVSYTLVNADQGNAITFEVTPVSTVAPTTGTPVVSSATNSVAAAPDTTPDAFTFVDQTGVALGTLTESAAITVAGINTAAAISVVGGDYQINGGAWTAAAGSVTNGQTVKVRHASSGSNSTAVNTTLTIGGVTDTFTTTTTAVLPAGYISQGGLTWMPVTFYTDWASANAYCANTTINGQTGWRMPTRPELSSLSDSGALAGAQGWTLDGTWSSTQVGAGAHDIVYLGGVVDWSFDWGNYYVSCVR